MSSDNPYAAPQTDPAYESDFVPGVAGPPSPAPRWKRFVNFLIDGVIGRIAVLGVGVGLGVMLVVTGQEQLLDQVTPLVDIIISTALFLAFYFVQEAAFGRTIGKLVTGTTVVNVDGSPITVGQALTRTLLRIVPFEPFSALFGKECVPWHDQHSQTRVVLLRKNDRQSFPSHEAPHRVPDA